MMYIFFLLILEAGVAVDVFLNHNWEEVYCTCKPSSVPILFGNLHLVQLHLKIYVLLLIFDLASGFPWRSNWELWWVQKFYQVELWDLQMDRLVNCICTGSSLICWFLLYGIQEWESIHVDLNLTKLASPRSVELMENFIYWMFEVFALLRF